MTDIRAFAITFTREVEGDNGQFGYVQFARNADGEMELNAVISRADGSGVCELVEEMEIDGREAEAGIEVARRLLTHLRRPTASS